jgi:hypothetical protein
MMPALSNTDGSPTPYFKRLGDAMLIQMVSMASNASQPFKLGFIVDALIKK